MLINHVSFPKTPRLMSPVIITEKIDGTNAGIHIRSAESWEYVDDEDQVVSYNGKVYAVRAQSRKRLLTPGDHDNYGFAAWVQNHAWQLVLLGEGVHFGEWWGKGIQRGYGLEERRFSLFCWTNKPYTKIPSCCRVVPLLHVGNGFGDIQGVCERLRETGSIAAPGFMNPEGIVVHHLAAGKTFKLTFEGKKEYGESKIICGEVSGHDSETITA